MKKSRLLVAVCSCVYLLYTNITYAGLVDKGNGLIYDDVLNITWAQPDIVRDRDDAYTWVSGLTLGGVTGWRFPYISVAAGEGPFTGVAVDCNTATEFACRDNEMGYMFYHNLGGTFGSSVLTSGDPDLALFPALAIQDYWSGTKYDSNRSWGFVYGTGEQFDGTIPNLASFTWAVHDGDVTNPAINCLGDSFESPFNGIITLNAKVKKAIPVKMSLVDTNGNVITDSDVPSPPVVDVSYTPGAGADDSGNADLVPPGLADDGNDFRFDYPYWMINLATKQFTSAGTYEVTAVAGDASYAIDASSCSGKFVRLP